MREWKKGCEQESEGWPSRRDCGGGEAKGVDNTYPFYPAAGLLSILPSNTLESLGTSSSELLNVIKSSLPPPPRLDSSPPAFSLRPFSSGERSLGLDRSSRLTRLRFVAAKRSRDPNVPFSPLNTERASPSLTYSPTFEGSRPKRPANSRLAGSAEAHSLLSFREGSLRSRGLRSLDGDFVPRVSNSYTFLFSARIDCSASSRSASKSEWKVRPKGPRR